MTVKLTRDLESLGIDRKSASRKSRAGTLTRVRHGAYTDAPGEDDRAALLQLIQGTWPLLADNAVLSHSAAAALHGLPLWPSMLQRVTTTRPSGGHGVRRPHLHVRVAPLEASEVIHLDGFRVTSLERTAIDVARTLAFEDAVAVLDMALRKQASKQLMTELLDAGAKRRGNGVARAALAFADPRAESVGESLSRVRMSQVGLPLPTLQFEVRDSCGGFVARTDFAWLDRGVVGEFDGRIKYVGMPEAVSRSVMAEKRREQAIRDAGWWIVRWDMADLADRTRFRQRILAAFDASAPSRQR